MFVRVNGYVLAANLQCIYAKTFHTIRLDEKFFTQYVVAAETACSHSKTCNIAVAESEVELVQMNVIHPFAYQSLLLVRVGEFLA